MNPLTKLNKQYIGGVWRDGKSDRVLNDTNPYSGSVVAEFKLASRSDLDEAYRAAASAQKVWAEVNPFEKRTILERAITWTEQNERDIAEIIIEELGGTHLKAAIEIFLVKTFIKEAQAAGFVGLAGHRSVGGIRASIYNAMDPFGCAALAAFMADFAGRH